MPRADFSKVYLGETGRQRFRVREKAHQLDTEQLEGIRYTRAIEKTSQLEVPQCMLTDHMVSENHTIYWKGVTLPVKKKQAEQREGYESPSSLRKPVRMLSTMMGGATNFSRSSPICFTVTPSGKSEKL